MINDTSTVTDLLTLKGVKKGDLLLVTYPAKTYGVIAGMFPAVVTQKTKTGVSLLFQYCIKKAGKTIYVRPEEVAALDFSTGAWLHSHSGVLSASGKPLHDAANVPVTVTLATPEFRATWEAARALAIEFCTARDAAKKEPVSA